MSWITVVLISILGMYWAQALAEQSVDAELQAQFKSLAETHWLLMKRKLLLS